MIAELAPLSRTPGQHAGLADLHGPDPFVGNARLTAGGDEPVARQMRAVVAEWGGAPMNAERGVRPKIPADLEARLLQWGELFAPIRSSTLDSSSAESVGTPAVHLSAGVQFWEFYSKGQNEADGEQFVAALNLARELMALREASARESGPGGAKGLRELIDLVESEASASLAAAP